MCPPHAQPQSCSQGRVPRTSFLRKGQTDDAETLEETLERSLKGLCPPLSDSDDTTYDARKVVRTCPGLLSVRGSKSAVQVVTIMTKLGVSSKSLSRDKSSLPILLSRSPAGLFRLVAFLSSTAVSADATRSNRAVVETKCRPSIDGCRAVVPVPNTPYSKQVTTESTTTTTTTTAAVVVETVTTTATATNVNDVAIAEPHMMQTAMATTGELDDADANATNEEEQTTTATTLDDDAAAWSRTRFDSSARNASSAPTDSSMTRTAGILRAQMAGDSNKDNSLALSKVVAAYPNVLLPDVEKQILPVARYLMGGLGIWKDDLASVLQLYPTLLGKTIEDLERVVAYKGISIRFVSMRIDTVLRFGDIDFARTNTS